MVSIPFPHLYLLLSFCLYISIFCIIIYDAGRLFFMLRRFPIESKGRRKKLHEVGSSLHLNLWDHICDSISLAAFVSLNEACICVCMYLLGFQFGIFPGKTNLAIDLLIINFFHGL